MSIEVQPSSGLLHKATTQPLTAIAHYSDHSVRDVTSLSLYESNDRAMVEVSDVGLVKALDLPGVAAVMVRYQGKVAVYNALFRWCNCRTGAERPRTSLNDYVFGNLKTLGIPPSPVCDDATFLAPR